MIMELFAMALVITFNVLWVLLSPNPILSGSWLLIGLGLLGLILSTLRMLFRLVRIFFPEDTDHAR